MLLAEHHILYLYNHTQYYIIVDIHLSKTDFLTFQEVHRGNIIILSYYIAMFSFLPQLWMQSSIDQGTTKPDIPFGEYFKWENMILITLIMVSVL